MSIVHHIKHWHFRKRQACCAKKGSLAVFFKLLPFLSHFYGLWLFPHKYEHKNTDFSSSSRCSTLAFRSIGTPTSRSYEMARIWDLSFSGHHNTLRDFIPLPRTKRVRKYEFCTITQLNFRSLFTTVCKGLLRFLVLKLEFEPLYQTDHVATCWRVKICQNLVISIDSFNLAFSIFLDSLFMCCVCTAERDRAFFLLDSFGA